MTTNETILIHRVIDVFIKMTTPHSMQHFEVTTACRHCDTRQYKQSMSYSLRLVDTNRGSVSPSPLKQTSCRTIPVLLMELNYILEVFVMAIIHISNDM